LVYFEEFSSKEEAYSHSGKSNPYDPKFVAEIEESREQYKKGEFISVNKKDIKSFLGLK
jgi:hypothetical protein